MLRLARDLYYSSGFTRTILTVCLFNHLVSKLLSQKSQRVFALQSKLDRMASAFTISERICVQGPLSALYSTPFFFLMWKKPFSILSTLNQKKTCFALTYTHTSIFWEDGSWMRLRSSICAVVQRGKFGSSLKYTTDTALFALRHHEQTSFPPR